MRQVVGDRLYHTLGDESGVACQLHVAYYLLLAMASNLIAMASNLLAMASNLIGMASTLLALQAIMQDHERSVLQTEDGERERPAILLPLWAIAPAVGFFPMAFSSAMVMH